MVALLDLVARLRGALASVGVADTDRPRPEPVAPQPTDAMTSMRRRLLDLPDETLRQPDRTTCGSASLVMTRMWLDPAFAVTVLDGPPPAVTDGPIAAGAGQRFGRLAIAVHDHTARTRLSTTGWQLPWPRALGTQPWTLALAATDVARAAGVLRGDERYRVTVVDPRSPGAAWDGLRRAVGAGLPALLYLGDGWAPRHVVLVVSADPAAQEVEPGPHGGDPADRLIAFEPSSGRWLPLIEQAFVGGHLDELGWPSPWAVLGP